MSDSRINGCNCSLRRKLYRWACLTYAKTGFSRGNELTAFVVVDDDGQWALAVGRRSVTITKSPSLRPCDVSAAEIKPACSTLWGIKKHTKILLYITSQNIDRFSKFFHWWIQEEICYKSLRPTTCPTTPHWRCCTTMRNRHVAKIALIQKCSIEESLFWK